MDYGVLIRKKMRDYFPMFGSILKSGMYFSTTDDAYNTDTGSVTEGSAKKYKLSVLFSAFEDNAVDGKVILSTDRKISFPSLNAKYEPKIKDEYHLGSEIWVVEGVLSDSAEAMVTLHIRRRAK